MRIATILSILLLSTSVFATTTVNQTWSGTGYVDIDVSTDDHTTHLETFGDMIDGEFHLTDYEDNPYGYGINTVDNWKKAKISNGYIYTWTRRDSSHSSMYGSAGQYTESFVGSDGTGEIAFGSRTNYASLKNCEYSRAKTSSGKQFEANGTFYQIYHMLIDGAGDGARFEVIGNGTSLVDIMNGETGWSGTGKSSFKFGEGCGCYHNCDATMTGKGTMYLDAWADNQLTTHLGGLVINGDGSDDSAQYHLTISYAGGFIHPGMAISGW